MQIFIQVKQLGKRKDIIKKQAFTLNNKPSTFKELLGEIVSGLVHDFNNRIDNTSDEKLLYYLLPNQIKNMATVGKISFDVDYCTKKADLLTAKENVYLAFNDGLFRTFLNQEEITKLHQNINLQENDTLIFIRLVMLAGRMW